MTTRFVGLKELRGSMAKISQEALKKSQRLIVLRKNEPIFELRPLSFKDRMIEGLVADVEEAKQDVRAKRVYTSKQVRTMLGL